MDSISTGMAETYLKFKKANVPAELHVYSGARHGFGIRKGDTGPSSEWPTALIAWLKEMNKKSNRGSKSTDKVGSAALYGDGRRRRLRIKGKHEGQFLCLVDVRFDRFNRACTAGPGHRTEHPARGLADAPVAVRSCT